MGAIGGTMAVTAGGKLWQSTGVGDYIADRIEGKPVDREKANDHIFAGASGKLQEQWNNMKQ